jgi:hypothetical protein
MELCNFQSINASLLPNDYVKPCCAARAMKDSKLLAHVISFTDLV